MEDDDKDIRIAALEAKNKQLERDIAERVRGFLIRAKGSKQINICNTTKTIEVQTEPAYFQKDNIESGLTLISMDSSPVPR